MRPPKTKNVHGQIHRPSRPFDNLTRCDQPTSHSSNNGQHHSEGSHHRHLPQGRQPSSSHRTDRIPMRYLYPLHQDGESSGSDEYDHQSNASTSEREDGYQGEFEQGEAEAYSSDEDNVEPPR
nr:uncharacterized protein CI109_006329 [Kwoniella shandongensis]KAA5525350.1 hypothetical protein CI109_006329 [Kwoniella shandongensis]